MTFIHDLYEGSLIGYTKCMECGYESQRIENFLDINLSIKNPFEKVSELIILKQRFTTIVLKRLSRIF
jgi:hypothetical protein